VGSGQQSSQHLLCAVTSFVLASIIAQRFGFPYILVGKPRIARWGVSTLAGWSVSTLTGCGDAWGMGADLRSSKECACSSDFSRPNGLRTESLRHTRGYKLGQGRCRGQASPAALASILPGRLDKPATKLKSHQRCLALPHGASVPGPALLPLCFGPGRDIIAALVEDTPRDQACSATRLRGTTPARCGRQGRHSIPREPVQRKGGLV